MKIISPVGQLRLVSRLNIVSTLCGNSTRARAIKPLDFVTKRLVSITLIFLFLPFFLDFLVSRFINIRLVLKREEEKTGNIFQATEQKNLFKIHIHDNLGKERQGSWKQGCG